MTYLSEIMSNYKMGETTKTTLEVNKESWSELKTLLKSKGIPLVSFINSVIIKSITEIKNEKN